MSPLVWCHCADAHLGYKQYNLPQRLHDFGSAFNECITQIINRNPDFIVFAGDLFEHYNPNPPELRQAIAILSKLRNIDGNGRSIPIYVVSGNHDVSYSASRRYGGDILDFLKDLELVHYLKDDIEIFEKDGKPAALIAGLRYYGKKTPEKLKEFYDTNKKVLTQNDIPKILVLHAFIEGSVASYDITTYGLNSYNFDYIAAGHYHLRWPSNFTDQTNRIYSSGATEHRTSAEWGSERGFITVTAEKVGNKWKIAPEFSSFPVREKYLIVHDFKLTTANDIIRVTDELVKQNDKKDAILKIMLQGTLKKGEFSFLNLQDVKNRVKNLLYIDITNNITTISIGGVAPKSEREAYLEILKDNYNIEKKHLDDYVALIENIIKIGNDRDFDELIEKIMNDFISKTPEAIKSLESKEKKEEIPGKKIVKKPKKPKPKKTLDSFSQKGV